MTDPISDFLTRIRNAAKAKHRVVEIPSSKMKKALTEILYQQGYILNYKFEDADPGHHQGLIKIALKYDAASGISAIRDLRRISSPGLRQYKGHDELPRVNNGLGIAIISTSKGVITDKEARHQNIGGEVICYIS
ncbi:MAG: 30S ribosomal protein S8 [Bacteroidota bacterium]|nr:30S ribosomal protein S8 [Bacteroidota bacterium]